MCVYDNRWTMLGLNVKLELPGKNENAEERTAARSVVGFVFDQNKADQIE